MTSQTGSEQLSLSVLVLGAYGLIGSAITTRLLADGHSVTGLGRNIEVARRRQPAVSWLKSDLVCMQTVNDWLPLLENVDVVINAAGVLQEGPRDNVKAIQETAMIALFDACAVKRDIRIIQISAIGAERAATVFMATKKAADSHLQSLNLDWYILRPGLVLSSAVYGGTGLIRALASFPHILPAAFGDRSVQTVHVEDVANAVSGSIFGHIPSRQIYDLVEPTPHRFDEVLLALRKRMGISGDWILPVPDFLSKPVFVLGDVLGRLGWRPPVRTAALKELLLGLTGDASAWNAVSDRPLAPLEETLNRITFGVQDIWFSRLWLLKPVIFAVLSLFWMASGIIGFIQWNEAVEILETRNISPALSLAIVLGGALIDVVLGITACMKRTAKIALLGMLTISLGYLGGATIWTTDLWLDPLGPLVKVLPAMVLALVALAVLRDR